MFDCGFNDIMSKYEMRDAARQLKYAFSENRLDNRPFVMHLCNMNKESQLWKELRKEIPNIEQRPIKFHAEDITDIFPTKNLVYLTPGAEDVIHDSNLMKIIRMWWVVLLIKPHAHQSHWPKQND